MPYMITAGFMLLGVFCIWYFGKSKRMKQFGIELPQDGKRKYNFYVNIKLKNPIDETQKLEFERFGKIEIVDQKSFYCTTTLDDNELRRELSNMLNLDLSKINVAPKRW